MAAARRGVLVAIGGWTSFSLVRRAGVKEAYGGHHHRRLGVGSPPVVLAIKLLLIEPRARCPRRRRRAVAAIQRGALFDPLPQVAPSRPLTLLESAHRSYDCDGASMTGPRPS
jgi:hypothetical protein